MSVLTLAIALTTLISTEAPAATEPPRSDVASLVARLVFGDPRTCAAASTALRVLGPAALPAPRAARCGNVPAPQPLAAAVIYREMTVVPIDVRFEFKDVPLP
jgi:hypothetical protein